MSADILEPVELYKKSFKEVHARNVSELFETFVHRSGVDEQANVKTVSEVRALEEQISSGRSSSRLWRILRGLVVLTAVACGVLAFVQRANTVIALASATVALIGLALVVSKFNPHIKSIADRLAQLSVRLEEKLKEAWGQMEPLNRLYHWSIFSDLMQKTVPLIKLDPYFSNGRLNELRDNFGWLEQFSEGKSVLFAHSGVLNGNPLVIAQTLNHWMGSKTYTGSIVISWTEVVRDSNGKSRTVTRTETLSASLDKPFPEYGKDPFIIYGNEAAPDLKFSREPSNLSSLGDGIFSNWRKKRAEKRLEAKSRDMKSDFTVMSNREFDSLFGAEDRDHEVQFRLLFTALAQQEMVNLLKDQSAGYGDDFAFTKAGMINLVRPAHMAATDISCDPQLVQSYDLSNARTLFNSYHNDLFKSVFFGLAPLFTIPLYQQHRSHADIYRDVYGRSSSFWEHESIANYFGEERFQHPECITRSILKTRSVQNANGTQVVRVSAFGYRGIEQIEYVARLGGDDRYHDVPVKWVEYIPVSHESEMELQDGASSGGFGEAPSVEDGQETAQGHGSVRNGAVLRRSVLASLR